VTSQFEVLSDVSPDCERVKTASMLCSPPAPRPAPRPNSAVGRSICGAHPCTLVDSTLAVELYGLQDTVLSSNQPPLPLPPLPPAHTTTPVLLWSLVQASRWVV
jgi:hypothetical protein